jgi:hypothetical protein
MTFDDPKERPLRCTSPRNGQDFRAILTEKKPALFTDNKQKQVGHALSVTYPIEN